MVLSSHLEDCISFEKQHTYAKLLSSVLLFSSSFRSEVDCANLQFLVSFLGVRDTCDISSCVWGCWAVLAKPNVLGTFPGGPQAGGTRSVEGSTTLPQP